MKRSKTIRVQTTLGELVSVLCEETQNLFNLIHRELSIADYSKVDEIPFDFSRKMMFVVVSTPG
jgi:magnesium-transporting ATPase (P-type)